VQGVLYASAASRHFDAPVAGSVYRSLKGRTLRGYWRRELLREVGHWGCEDDELDEPGFEKLVSDTEVLVSTAIEGIRLGRIPRSPYSKDACRFCGLASTCASAQ